MGTTYLTPEKFLRSQISEVFYKYEEYKKNNKAINQIMLLEFLLSYLIQNCYGLLYVCPDIERVIVPIQGEYRL